LTSGVISTSERITNRKADEAGYAEAWPGCSTWNISISEENHSRSDFRAGAGVMAAL